MSIELRPYRDADEAFLFELYADTRGEEIAAWGWDQRQRDAFLKQQFEGQRASYRLQFADAAHSIITDAGRPIGRIMVRYAAEEIRIVDISLLAARRNEGIGTRLIREILADAAAAGKPVRLAVLTANPALALYRRLGFSVIGGDELYLQMEAGWPPHE